MLKQLLTAIILSALITPALAHSGPDHDADHARDDNASTPESPAQAIDKAKAESNSDESSKRRQSPGFGKEPHATVDQYKDDEVLGFKLKVHEDLLADEELWAKVKAELHHQLYLVEQALPEDKVGWLKTVMTWVELDNPYHNSAQYHPSEKWLTSNGYLAEKAHCVEISNAKGFIRR